MQPQHGAFHHCALAEPTQGFRAEACGVQSKLPCLGTRLMATLRLIICEPTAGMDVLSTSLQLPCHIAYKPIHLLW